MSLTHPEPEVRELAKWAQDDDTVGLMVHRILQNEKQPNLSALFDAKPDVVFELHDECALLIEQCPPDEHQLSVGEMQDLLTPYNPPGAST